MTTIPLQDEDLFRHQAYIGGRWCDADCRRCEVYDAFAEKLVAAVAKLKVGNGFEPGVQQGPLIDRAAVEKVEEHIKDAVSKGGRVLLGGKRHALGQTFFQPTVLADVTPQMKVAGLTGKPFRRGEALAYLSFA